MFGIGPYLGRVFAESDDTPSSSPVVVLSYRTWQTEFAGDPWIVGSTISIQTKPFTVIGIAPPGFFGDRVTDVPADIWMPVNMEPYARGNSSILTHQDSNWLYAIGRVRPGTNIGALQAKLSQALRGWLSTRPVYTDNGGSTIIPKQHVVIVPAGGGIQNLQQQAGHRTQDADGAFLALSCSLRAPTSPICCWRAAPPAVQISPFAWPWEPAAAVSSARSLPRACS